MGFDTRQFIANLEGEAKKRAMAAAARAVDQYGQHVIGVAATLCPVETGTLQNSGLGLPAVQMGTNVAKEIGFNTSYAAAVHERLDLHHDQGQAKFLESAMVTEASKLRPFVKQELDKAL
jgi:hypothetical protein